MDWVHIIQEYWWIIITLAAIIGFIVKSMFAMHVVKLRIDRCERHDTEVREDIKYLLRCSFATLDGLKQLKCNGAVVSMYDEMRKFVLTQHKG